MLTLYSLENSRAFRVEWVLQELNLEYRVEQYHRDKETTKGPDGMEKIHPAGKFPLLVDGDITLAESGFIIEYLIEKYGNGSDLLGADAKEKLHVRYGVLISETNMAGYQSQLNIHKLARPRLPWGASGIGNKILDKIDDSYALPNLRQCLDALQKVVQENGGFWSNGHLTAADIMFSYNINSIQERGFFSDFGKKWPILVTYGKDLKDLYNKSAASKKGLCKEVKNHS